MASALTRPKSPFLVFEGLDGAGKGTLISLLIQELARRGHFSRLTREPGGTPLAEEIRRLLLKTEGETPVAETELLLYAASRAQHVAIVIETALRTGEWVVCDRFIASSVAFQCFARGLSRSETDWLNAFAIRGRSPDLTILLDLSVEESARRQLGRESKDRMESEADSFHQKVREGYLAQAKENPAAWLVLDAMKSPARLLEETVSELEKRGWLASKTN